MYISLLIYLFICENDTCGNMAIYKRAGIERLNVLFIVY